VDAEFQGVMAWRGSKENPFEPLPELCLTVHTPEELQTSVARKAAALETLGLVRDIVTWRLPSRSSMLDV